MTIQLWKTRAAHALSIASCLWIAGCAEEPAGTPQMDSGIASNPAAGMSGAMIDAGCMAAGTCAGMGGSGAMQDAAVMHDAAVQDAAVRDAAVHDSGSDAMVTPDAAIDAGGEDEATREGWSLTYREEFSGSAGDSFDESTWNAVNKGDGFGNNELEFYTGGRSENVRQDGAGNLIIETREEPWMGREYTSTRLESKGKFEQQYGRFEIRAKLPFGQGIWPAFWLLGNDISEVSWPECGEVDIMEHVGKTPSTNYGSLHGPGYSGGNPLSAQYHLDGDARFADDFHTYAVEWEEDVVRWYVDDELYETRTPADVPGGGHWVYDHPFYMILNVAVGGAFPGSPDDSTTFPQQMLVDHIRVYERD